VREREREREREVGSPFLDEKKMANISCISFSHDLQLLSPHIFEFHFPFFTSEICYGKCLNIQGILCDEK